MDVHISNITVAFSEIVRSFNKFQLSEHSAKSITDGKKIMSDGTKLLHTLKHYTRAIESVLIDCSDYVEEIQDDLSTTPPPEDFVYPTKHGMLSYNGRDYIDKFLNEKTTNDNNNEVKEASLNTSSQKLIIKPTVHKKVFIKEVGYYMDMPVVDKFSEIPPMFYYYNNIKDKINEPGVYCALLPGVIIKVPFPVIVDSTREYGRGRSIKCKYAKRATCDENRESMAKRYSSDVRKCNFAHEGENIVKIGYPSRCSTMPRFGNASTLTSDLNVVQVGDIKNILLYGLSDVMVSAIWFDHHKQRPGVYSRVDVA